MKRTPLKRTTPLKRSAPVKAKSKKSRGVPPELTAEVTMRDRGCRGAALISEVKCWGRLDPHHILRRSQGGQDTAENLITLCRAHHDWVHQNPATSRQLGLLRRPDNTRKEQ